MFDELVSVGDLFVDDGADTFNMTGSPDYMYDLHKPTGGTGLVMVGIGSLELIYFGKLGVILYCETGVKMIMHDVALVDNFKFNLFSCLANPHTATIKKTGAHLWNGRVTFRQLKSGLCIEASRVEHREAGLGVNDEVA